MTKVLVRNLSPCALIWTYVNACFICVQIIHRLPVEQCILNFHMDVLKKVSIFLIEVKTECL